jgi:hypothetical protein
MSDYQNTVIADRKCFLYDEGTRTFYAALAPNEDPPKMIGIPSASPNLSPKYFYLDENTYKPIDLAFKPFVIVYSSSEKTPYHILLYNDVNLMREHWKIRRELSGKDAGATARYSIV